MQTEIRMIQRKGIGVLHIPPDIGYQDMCRLLDKLLATNYAPDKFVVNGEQWTFSELASGTYRREIFANLQ